MGKNKLQELDGELHLANINVEMPVKYLNEDIMWPGDVSLALKGEVTNGDMHREFSG